MPYIQAQQVNSCQNNYAFPCQPSGKAVYGITSNVKRTELDFTFIPAPVTPEHPTSVGLSIREKYSVVTLYSPEPEDIPEQFQFWSILDRRHKEHEASLHRNKQGDDDHYHFKFENNDKTEINAFILYAIQNYLIVKNSAFDTTYENFLTAKKIFISDKVLNQKIFENQDCAQRNTAPPN